MGRPKGSKNKAVPEIRRLARQYSPRAVKILMGIAENSPSDAAKVSAVGIILDRAYGKAPQAMTGENGEGPVKLVISWEDPA